MLTKWASLAPKKVISPQHQTILHSESHRILFLQFVMANKPIPSAKIPTYNSERQHRQESRIRTLHQLALAEHLIMGTRPRENLQQQIKLLEMLVTQSGYMNFNKTLINYLES